MSAVERFQCIMLNRPSPLCLTLQGCMPYDWFIVLSLGVHSLQLDQNLHHSPDFSSQQTSGFAVVYIQTLVSVSGQGSQKCNKNTLILIDLNGL